VPVDPPNKENGLLDYIFKRLKKHAQDLQKTEGDAKKAIKRVCDCRGEGVIEQNKDKIMKSIGVSESEDELKKKNLVYGLILGSVHRDTSEFDESVLLWHIATDLCLLPDKQEAATEPITWRRSISKTLSEYMLYLLVKQPEMLSATAGIGLLRYRDTCASWCPAEDEQPDLEKDTRKMLLSVNTSKKPATVKGDRSKSVLFDAVILAKALKELGDDVRWKIITGVWREMLTFAAGKCRGSTHVRQLSRGGELITIIWFLMAHMGFGDMYQIQSGNAKAKVIVIDQ